jgi:hypothetical protein
MISRRYRTKNGSEEEMKGRAEQAEDGRKAAFLFLFETGVLLSKNNHPALF